MAALDLNSVFSITKALEKRPKNRIYRVGIELEGGWTKLPIGTTLAHDGSVKVEPPPECRPRLDATTGLEVRPKKKFTTGELPSEPMEPEKVPMWIKTFYPQHVNATCGLHVHMSFKSAFHYQRLMVPEYTATILTYVRKWAEDERLTQAHPIWNRLKGMNTYCKPEFFADQQVIQARKNYAHDGAGASRYTVINYCYNLHTTVECRLLPMMETADQAIAAVQRVMDITNACLAANKEKEKKIKGEILMDDDELIRDALEEHIEPVRRNGRIG